MNAIPSQLEPKKKGLGLRIRSFLVNWVMQGVHLQKQHFGVHSVTVGAVINISANSSASANGDIGRDGSDNVTAKIGGVTDDIVAGLTAAQTFENKELTTPTIGSFVNAGHDHTAGAGGGKLTNTALTTGVFPAITGLGAQSQNLDVNSNAIVNVPNATTGDQAVNKSQLDAAVSGLVWLPPAEVNGYFANLTIAGIDLLTPSSSDSVVAEDPGIPSAGTSDALVIGDLAEFNGTEWKKIVSASGGFPPVGTRALVSTTATLTLPLTNGTDDGKVAEWDGTSLTPALTNPVDDNAVLIDGDLSVNENKQFVFSGIVPTGTWVQFGGIGLAHSSLSGLTTGDAGHTQFVMRDGSKLLTANWTMGDFEILPTTNFGTAGGAGKVGRSDRRWSEVNAFEGNFGDVNLKDDAYDAHWTLIERHDYLIGVNRKTGTWHRLGMVEIEPETGHKYAPPA